MSEHLIRLRDFSRENTTSLKNGCLGCTSVMHKIPMLSDHPHAPCPSPTCDVPITCPQRLHPGRTCLAVALSLVIQACTASAPMGTPIGPGSAPSTDPSFDAFDFCVRKTETSQHDCFEQAIQVNHLSLPAGTTTEQAFIHGLRNKGATMDFGWSGRS